MITRRIAKMTPMMRPKKSNNPWTSARLSDFQNEFTVGLLP